MAKTVKSAVKRQVRRTAKRNPAAMIVLIVALAVGVVAGYSLGVFLTKNDGFSLKGEKTATYTVGDGGGSVTLAEDGWTLTALGRDATESVSVETDLQKTDGGYVVPTDQARTYHIVYRSSHFLFSKYSLVRTVTVKAAEGGAD